MAPRRRSGTRSKKLSIMNNKWFLYFLSIVAVGQLVTYGIDEKWESTVLFVVIGLLAHNYTKNMIFVLLLAIIGTGILTSFIKFNEGFKEGADEEEEEDDEDQEEMKGTEEKEDHSDDEDEDFTSNHVDKASTMSKNLENIKSIVGSGGINKMTRETAALMKQQNQMLENMEKMKPLTEQAVGLVEKLEGSSLVKTMASNKAKFQNASKQLGALNNIA
tara:strand:+ start:1672 stop:2325 length:654 start_codon:yes stop_codon:yes gene_type:complete